MVRVKFLKKKLFCVGAAVVCSVVSAHTSTSTTQKHSDFSTNSFKKCSEGKIDRVKRAMAELSSYCAEHNFYGQIFELLSELLSLATQELENADFKGAFSSRADAARSKMFQIASLLSVSSKTKFIEPMSAVYRALEPIFCWPKCTKLRLEHFFKKSCFFNGIKHWIESPVGRLAKVFGAILVCVKLVDFLKNPSDTLGGKERKKLKKQFESEVGELKRQYSHLEGENRTLRNSVACHEVALKDMKESATANRFGTSNFPPGKLEGMLRGEEDKS